MNGFEHYTPEMLIYYHSLSPGLQKAVRSGAHRVTSIEELERAAELCAQSGLAADGAAD